MLCQFKSILHKSKRNGHTCIWHWLSWSYYRLDALFDAIFNNAYIALPIKCWYNNFTMTHFVVLNHWKTIIIRLYQRKCQVLHAHCTANHSDLYCIQWLNFKFHCWRHEETGNERTRKGAKQWNGIHSSVYFPMMHKFSNSTTKHIDFEIVHQNTNINCKKRMPDKAKIVFLFFTVLCWHEVYIKSCNRRNVSQNNGWNHLCFYLLISNMLDVQSTYSWFWYSHYQICFGFQ